MTDEQSGHTAAELETARQRIEEQIDRDERTLQLVKEASRPSWFYRHLVAPLKRSHWFFRLGDFIRVRLERQDRVEQNVETLVKSMIKMQDYNRVTAEAVNDIRQRLRHHEEGPLKASRGELDRRRKDGVPRPLMAKRNGRSSVAAIDDARSTPTKERCVHGALKDECPTCSVPGGVAS